MPEPLTIAKSVGGLLGLAVSTTKSTSTAITSGKRAHRTLPFLGRKYEGLKGRTKRWDELWVHGESSKESLRRSQLWWGQAGAKHIDGLLQDVTWASKKLAKEFCEKKGWRRMKTSKAWCAITFSLFGKRENISDLINTLDDALDQLYEMSTNLYNEQRGTPGANEPTLEDLVNIQKLHARAKGLEETMTELHSALRFNVESPRASASSTSTTSAWGLLLTRPEQFGELLLSRDGRYRFRLFSQQQIFVLEFDSLSQRHANSRSLRPLRPLHDERLELRNSLTEVIANIHQIVSQEPNQTPSATTSRRVSAQIKFKRSTGTSIAEMALVLASWFVMLWGTPWMKNMCNCQIFRARSQLSSKARTQVWTGTALWPTPHECGQHDHLDADKPLLQLGTLLAELALLVTKPSLAWSTTPEPRLLRKVQRATSESYSKAVEFCISPILQRSMTHVSHHDKAEFYRRKIIVHLYDHYERYGNLESMLPAMEASNSRRAAPRQ
ncbi:hypothetical protein LTR56_022967 [Elasticomyces elasticus]|nr:hypothetical protein LTR56_022967 [Elasticomyces elasticus]KAK3626998.1 hypothetical protein LTR22_022955 [Elasticomyces elasticus]KAK5750418.1 hypothetical protein LTS12_019526 [Elasticomyces elasticus]